MDDSYMEQCNGVLNLGQAIFRVEGREEKRGGSKGFPSHFLDK